MTTRFSTGRSNEHAVFLRRRDAVRRSSAAGLRFNLSAKTGRNATKLRGRPRLTSRHTKPAPRRVLRNVVAGDVDQELCLENLRGRHAAARRAISATSARLLNYMKRLSRND
jgi:hypothetical protein